LYVTKYLFKKNVTEQNKQNKQATAHWENADSELLRALIQSWKRSAINMYIQ